jgi:hypothetical protein
MTIQDPAPTENTPTAPSQPPAGQPPAAQPPGAQPPAPPAWRPPATGQSRNGALVFGAIIIVIGLWFFATSTLGLDLPELDWGSLWPLLLIGVGAWIVLGAMDRRR